MDQAVCIFESLYRDSVVNEKEKVVPRLCCKFYSLPSCTLEGGIHHIELLRYIHVDTNVHSCLIMISMLLN